jgi:predicted short-subunit dehydrogenase-like oxidoreductase (DUF2520 family)
MLFGARIRGQRGRVWLSFVPSRPETGREQGFGPSLSSVLDLTPSGISMRELERDFPATTTQHLPAAPSRLAIVGYGRAGGAIGRAASAAGIVVSAVRRGQIRAAMPHADAALICVPDSAIAEVGEEIAAGEHTPVLVGHVSGATSLAALAPVAAAGAETFVMHPLQTLPDPESDLTGARCAVAGSSANATAAASALASSLGMEPFELDDEMRSAYHAAASMASNFLVALEESAASLLASAGVADPRAALSPLVLRSAGNWSERGAAALTGPIARGDKATVARHLDALREHAPELLPMYEALAERTRAIAASADGATA